MRRIAILNQKGGVGKTTTVVNVAAALALTGQRILVVDLDPQAHLTIHLGVDAEQTGVGAYEVLTKSASVKDSVIQVRPNLYLLGANIDLVGAESELVSVVGRETILREAIEPVNDEFDYLIIDCPPSLGLLTLNSLAAVDEVMIPIQPHFLALQGFGKLLQTVSLVSRRINPQLKVSAIILCMFDSRTSLSSEVKADIQNFLKNAHDTESPWSDCKVIPIHVRRNIKLAEAPSYGKTIFEYEPNCHGAEDYINIAAYIQAGMKLKQPQSHIPDISEGSPDISESQTQPAAEVGRTESSARAEIDQRIPDGPVIPEDNDLDVSLEDSAIAEPGA